MENWLMVIIMKPVCIEAIFDTDYALSTMSSS